MNASKGAEEFRVGEIFIAANSANEAEAQAQIEQIYNALQQGGSFVGYARQYSQSSSQAVGGDLGWVRPELLPAELSDVVRQMRPGMISRPIKVPGGYSIVAVAGHAQDPDRRSAQCNLEPEAGDGAVSEGDDPPDR